MPAGGHSCFFALFSLILSCSFSLCSYAPFSLRRLFYHLLFLLPSLLTHSISFFACFYALIPLPFASVYTSTYAFAYAFACAFAYTSASSSACASTSGSGSGSGSSSISAFASTSAFTSISAYTPTSTTASACQSLSIPSHHILSHWPLNINSRPLYPELFFF